MKTCPNCYVQYTAVTHEPYVTLCPLHAAAKQMYTVLETFRTWLVAPAHDKDTLDGMYDIAQAALLAASSPQEPADDSEMPLGPIKAPARGLES